MEPESRSLPNRQPRWYAPPMRKAVIGLLVVVVAAAGVFLAGFRRVPAGGGGWNATAGELRLAGGSSLLVPRWRWRGVAGGPLACDVTATSREGARVTAHMVATLPAGRHVLAPAATPEAGLAAALDATVRERLAALPMACFTGLGASGCPADLERDLATAAAGRLGVAPDAVSVRLEPDREALAAARRAALKERVGRPPRRVLVVGWDGADWEIIGPLARHGAMPNLARLMAEGTYGRLASITPLLSPLIWTTIATGVGPEEHGILDFVEVDPVTGQKVPVTGRGRRVPALWNDASAAGESVAVSGWWATWPAEAVNGVLISDRLFFLLSGSVAEAPAGTVVFPPQLEAQYRSLAERAESETDEATIRSLLPVSDEAYRAAIAGHKGLADPIDGFRRIMVGTRTYFGAALLAAEAKPDLEMVYCIGTDEVGHVLAPYLPPPLPGTDPSFAPIAETGVERYFSIVDRWLGRLVEACPPSQCAIVLVSDHGFKWSSDRPREFSGVAAATAALWHRPYGIFVVAGNGVKRLGEVAEAPSVYDVAPTIAALLGLPPGEDWRGKPLPGVAVAGGRPVNWAALVPPDSYRQAAPGAQASPEYVAQLKALGYLEGSEGGGKGARETEGDYNNLGLVQLEAKKYDAAEKAFRDSIAANPRYASPHYNLRRLYFETGRYDQADGELWRAIELGLRDSVGAVDRAALDYERIGQPDRSLSLLAEGVRRFPDAAGLAVHRLALLVKLGRCAEAVQAGRAVTQRFERDAGAQAFFGLAAACAGDAATARAAFERSLAIDPNQPEVRQALESLDAAGH